MGRLKRSTTRTCRLTRLVSILTSSSGSTSWFEFPCALGSSGAAEGEVLSFGAAGGGGTSDELTTGPVCGVRAGVCVCLCCAPVCVEPFCCVGCCCGGVCCCATAVRGAALTRRGRLSCAREAGIKV